MRLEWSGPEECIAERELTKLVEANRSIEPVSAARRVIGEAEKLEQGYRFSLELWENERRIGQRIFDVEGGGCRVDDASLALVIAMLLEGPELPQTTPVGSVTSELVRFEVAPRREPVSSSSLSLAALIAPGLTPNVVPGPLLGLALRRGRFAGRMEFAYLPPSSTSRLGAADARLDAALLGLFGCGVIGEWALRWEACAGARATILWARGEGFPSNFSRESGLFSFSAFGRGAFLVARHAEVFGQVGIDVPTHRVTIVGFDEGGVEHVLFQTERVVPHVALGFGWSW